MPASHHRLGIFRGAPTVKTGQSHHSSTKLLKKAWGGGRGEMDSVAGDTSYQRKKVGASCLNTKSVGTSWPRPLASRGVFLVARPTKNGRADSLLGAPCAVSMDPEALPADRLCHPYLPVNTAQAKGKTQAVLPAS